MIRPKEVPAKFSFSSEKLIKQLANFFHLNGEANPEPPAEVPDQNEGRPNENRIGSRANQPNDPDEGFNFEDGQESREAIFKPHTVFTRGGRRSVSTREDIRRYVKKPAPPLKPADPLESFEG